MLKLPGLHMGVSQLALRSASGVETGVSKDPTTSLTLGEPGETETPKAKFSENGAVKTEPTDVSLEDEDGEGDEEDGGADPDAGESGDDADDTDGPLEDLGDYSEDRHDEFDARYRAEDGSLNEAVLTREFDQNGGKGLNEGTYAFFEALGFSKTFVKGVEAGQVALREKSGDAIVQAAGGPEALSAAVAWGKKSYTPEQRKKFNEVMKTGSAEARQEAVELLVARHSKATGKGPLGRRRTTPIASATEGSNSSASTGRGFATRDAWQKAREEAKGNPRKEAEVRLKLRQSNRRAWSKG